MTEDQQKAGLGYQDYHYQEYQIDSDPLHVIRVLQSAYLNKVPLPVWALEVLGAAAHKYFLSEGGNASFDELLGLQAGRGRDNKPIKRYYKREFRAQIAWRVAEANKLLKFTLPVAYWLVRKTCAPHISSSSWIQEIYKSEEKKYILPDENDRLHGLFTTMKIYGYDEVIFNNEKELRDLGLFDSAINTIKKLLNSKKYKSLKPY